jgi:tetratricopeptide (TPR) repeat protein
MKKIVILISVMHSLLAASAQFFPVPPAGANQKCEVAQWIGPVKVTITYNSPDVHSPRGEDRTGKIWGKLVHYGLKQEDFGTAKGSPWRAGANENTTISFSHDVKVEGKELKAGTYGLFLLLAENGPWTWIFSKHNTSWGSFYYNPAQDALRVNTTPVDASYTEWLTYGFDDRLLSSATAYLQWEKKKIPMKIEIPNTIEIYLAGIRAALTDTKFGFSETTFSRAAQFCVDNKVNLEEALEWAEAGISRRFIGQESFYTLYTKANVLYALGRKQEAEAVIVKAIKRPGTTAEEVYTYAFRQALAGNKETALFVMQQGKEIFTKETHFIPMGFARVYTITGDKEKAIASWEIVIKNLPDDKKNQLPAFEAALKKLKE